MGSDDDLITLYAMSAKGLAVLRGLDAARLRRVAMVVGSRDPSVAEDSYEDIVNECARRNIPFTDRTDASRIETPYGIAISWRWLVDVPDESSLVVFHDSLLPRYRGFNPLVTALLAGDHEAGVTAIIASQEYDRGPIVSQVRVGLEYPTRIADAIAAIADGYLALARDVIDVMVRMNPAPLEGSPQDERLASYSLWRDDDDYDIDWQRSSVWVRDFVNSVGHPYNGARTTMLGRYVRVLEVELEEDVEISNRDPGKLIFLRNGEPTVVCGSGLARITDLRDDSTGEQLLPLRRFRVRFGGSVPSSSPIGVI